ncbi:MAG: cardiolipin synthase [Planctomycetota bacterium]|nr:cardiolipin synthase [Planctomycetota bacterium]
MHYTWYTISLFALDLVIRIGLSVRVIMRRRPVGVSLAWLMIILIFPFLGAFIYLLFGELRLGNRRARRAEVIHEPYEQWLKDLRRRVGATQDTLDHYCQPLAQLTESAVGIPVFPGNEITLLDDWQHVFRAVIADIDAAQRTCHMVFYIWNVGGSADEVAEALMRAVQRGVICRVLVDDVGSRPFLRSPLAKKMRDAGVQLHAALPGGPIRMLFVRYDLRMHRKIVVIDGQIAYTGSLNLVDPRHFKQDAGVGEWVDAMVRVRGPAVEGLAITFIEDWELETGVGLDQLRETGDVQQPDELGTAKAQVIPSGPAVRNEAIQEILLMAIYSAQRELVLTTPYFVPEESLRMALISAARRGVHVILIVPAKVDSMLVRLASQAFKGDLCAAGVEIRLFDAGLLHTKSITIDGQRCLFGSLNLDPRSLFLNFEITLGIYDQPFASQLRRLQQSYIDQSEIMDLQDWEARSGVQRFTENVARLVGPLL